MSSSPERKGKRRSRHRMEKQSRKRPHFSSEDEILNRDYFEKDEREGRHKKKRYGDRDYERIHRHKDVYDRSKNIKKENHLKRDKDKDDKASKKIEPNMKLSGKLTEDTNTYNGVVIKYNEPEEARKPKRRWRLYPFKGEQTLPFIPIHRQSAYLLGRSRLVADIPIDHPSCSKQHAVLQYRLIDYEREDGTTGKRVRPYIIDLDSANGTYVNNKQIEARRYVELLEKDVIKFGFSTREYVIIHEDTKEIDDE